MQTKSDSLQSHLNEVKYKRGKEILRQLDFVLSVMGGRGELLLCGIYYICSRYLKERASFPADLSCERQRKPSPVFLNNMIQEGL